MEASEVNIYKNFTNQKDKQTLTTRHKYRLAYNYYSCLFLRSSSFQGKLINKSVR